jgi:predicted phage terminase large subunit-like protein
MEPLRHCTTNKDFAAVFFRRNTTQVRNPGGLWDESAKLYPTVGASPIKHTLEWVWPKGGRVKFAHLEHDTTVYDWQGSQIPLICFDELTHFSKTQFFYMLSRNRSMCGVRPYVRATCNPDADSWVAGLISWWIDQETGFPIPERAGKLRWFARVNDELIWADSPSALTAQMPLAVPKSFTFVPAKLTDNPALMKADPGYLANLMALPLVDRERLLGGNWKVRPAAGKVFNRGWFEIVDAVPAGGMECRFWDFASTEKAMKGDDPDYTASTLMRRVGGMYYILDSTAEQIGPAEVERRFLNVSRQDKARADQDRVEYHARWEIEPGSAAKRDTAHLVTQLAGIDARGRRAVGDKLVRAKPLAAQAEAGNVKLLRGPWVEGWLRHMHGQPDLEHDDIMDASAGAFYDLATPSFRPL